MPIIAQYKLKKWYNNYRNGASFNENNSDFTPNLRANQHEKALFVGELVIYQKLDASGIFLKNDTNNGIIGNPFTMKSDNLDFSELNLGDSIRVVVPYQVGNSTFTGTIRSVEDGLIYLDNYQGDTLVYIENNVTLGSVFVDGSTILVTTPLNYLRYKWGFSDSNGSANTESKLDGRTNAFELSDIDFSTKEAVKGIKNQNDDRLFVTRLSNESIPEVNLTSYNEAQKFEIKHDFYLDDYSEDDISLLDNGIVPDRYLGEINQNYFSDLEFRTQKSAPETAKKYSYLDKSDTGWFKENFNGGINKFSVANVQLFRILTNEDLEDVSSTQTTRVTLTVQASEPSFEFGVGLRYILNHKTLLLGEDYEFKDTPFKSLFDFDSVLVDDLNIGNSTIIKNAQASNVTDNSFDLSFELDINKSYEETNYITSITIGKKTLDNKSRNTVTIPIDIGTYFNTFDVLGLLGNVTMELFQRDCDPYSNVGVSSFDMISGEIIYTKLLIPVNDGLIDSIHLETYNYDGATIGVVDSQEIDTSGFLIINDEQEIEETLPTPYSTGFDGRIRKVSNGLYEVIFPYRLPFDKNIAVNDLNDVLFDQLEPNKGFNQSVFYQQSKGLDIHIGYRIGMFAENRITFYRYKTEQPILVKDFENNL